MRMPGRDGAELIKDLQLRTDRSFEYVMISGHLDAEQDIAGIKGDDVKLMRKPIDIEDLMSFLEALSFA